MFISSSGYEEEPTAAAPETVDIEQRMTAIERSLDRDSMQWLLIVLAVMLIFVTVMLIMTPIIIRCCFKNKAKDGPTRQLFR
jgi:hypothetical protein